MTKLNCREVKKCGREPGGSKTAELGICPAAITINYNGIHEGKNGGRSCWVIAGTLCGGQVQGRWPMDQHSATRKISGLPSRS